MNEKTNTTPTKTACPECDSESSVYEEITSHEFHYGVGKEAVILSAIVPINICNACGFRFLDYRAEIVEHEVICQHLGLLNPKEIKQVRENLSLNRSDFSKLTGIGEASIARWESGATLQSESSDKYLRLIRKFSSASALERAMSNDESSAGKSLLTPKGPPRLRCIKNTAPLDKKASQFQLRKAVGH